jgi:hypothetical protein
LDADPLLYAIGERIESAIEAPAGHLWREQPQLMKACSGRSIFQVTQAAGNSNPINSQNYFILRPSKLFT